MRCSNVTRHRRQRSAWRLLWATVLVLHGPATWSAFSALWRPESSAVAWSSLLFLAVSNVFFIVEIVFAYSLHLLTNRRAALALLLVVGLLHAGVIERGLPEVLAAFDLRPWAFLTVVSVWFLGTLLRLLAARPSLATAVGPDDLRCRRVLDRCSLAMLRPLHLRPLISCWGGSALRAPPFSHS